MAVSKHVATTHEDWLNLCDPEPPWFTLPVMKRAFPEGLHPVPSTTRAEHKIRWDQAYNAPDRTEYVDWLLRNGLGWLAHYRTGDNLPEDLAAGIAEQGVMVAPTGAYIPPTPATVGVFGDIELDQTEPAPQVLVFVLAAGTDPASRPRDGWPANHIQRAAKCCRHFKVSLALVTDGDHLTLVHASPDHTTGWGTWRASVFATEPVLLDSFSTMLGSRRFTTVTEVDSPAALLAESAGSQAEVTDQLGFQVRRAVELLVSAISRADRSRNGVLLADVKPGLLYEAGTGVI